MPDFFFLVLLTLAFLIGCGTQNGLMKVKLCKEPSWFTDIPVDTNYLFSVTTGTSQDSNLARDKAAMDGRVNLVRQSETLINSLRRKIVNEGGEFPMNQSIYPKIPRTNFFDELDNEAKKYDNYKREINPVFSENLKKVDKYEICKDDMFRAYVLSKVKIVDLLISFINECKEFEEKLKGSKTYNEIKMKVENREK